MRGYIKESKRVLKEIFEEEFLKDYFEEDLWRSFWVNFMWMRESKMKLRKENEG